MEISIFLVITSLTYCFSIQRFILQAKVAFKLQLALASVLLGAWTKKHCLPSLSFLWDGSRNFSFISENNGEIRVDKYRSLHVLTNKEILSLPVNYCCVFWNFARQHFVAERQFKVYEKLCYPWLPSHSISV